MTSSKSITCGSIARARAIATRCCWPPESRSGYSPILSAIPTRVSNSSPRRRHWSSERPSTVSGASITFSSAVCSGNRLNCWKTMPTRWRTKSIPAVPLPVISSPSRTIRPLSGGESRLMQRSSVLFPEPLGPSTQTTSPRLTVSSTPSRTTSSPKLLRISCSPRMEPSGAVLSSPVVGTTEPPSGLMRSPSGSGPADGRSYNRRAGPAGSSRSGTGSRPSPARSR